MATTLMRPKEVTIRAGGGRPRRPDDIVKCKKHPKHSQSPGVCSLCLTEKLSQLLAKIEKGRNVVLKGEGESSLSSCSSALSSYYSSSQGSSCSSPMHRYTCVFAMDGKGSSSSSSSLSSLFTSGKNVLTKSRSLAFVQRNKERRGGNGDIDAKKSGFWSKLLLRPSTTRHKTAEAGDLVHSKTVREITV